MQKEMGGVASFKRAFHAQRICKGKKKKRRNQKLTRNTRFQLRI